MIWNKFLGGNKTDYPLIDIRSFPEWEITDLKRGEVTINMAMKNQNIRCE